MVQASAVSSYRNPIFANGKVILVRQFDTALAVQVNKRCYECLSKEYADDGFSGTNFERPAFQEMLNLVEQGKLEIDPESAKVVRDIFSMYIERMSAYAIAKLLNEWQIDSPNTRLEKSILSNQVMAGDMVGHKCSRIEVGRNVCKDIDKSEWVIVSNTHEAIVESEIFAEVQKRLSECSTKR